MDRGRRTAPTAPFGCRDSGVVGADFTPYVSHGHWALGADSAAGSGSATSAGAGRPSITGDGSGSAAGAGVGFPAGSIPRRGSSREPAFTTTTHVGWAPMPPTWYWYGGWAYGLGFYPPAPYVFCSATYVFSPYVRPYIAPPARVAVIRAPHATLRPGEAHRFFGGVLNLRDDPRTEHGRGPHSRGIRAGAARRARSAGGLFRAYASSVALVRNAAGRCVRRAGEMTPRPSTFPSTHGSSVFTTRPPTGARSARTSAVSGAPDVALFTELSTRSCRRSRMLHR